MADESTLAQINELADEEHRLRSKQSAGAADDSDRARLVEVEELLDQCWDLLRQRRALREFDQDPDDAHARPIDVVENYEN